MRCKYAKCKLVPGKIGRIVECRNGFGTCLNEILECGAFKAMTVEVGGALTPPSASDLDARNGGDAGRGGSP